MGSDIGTEITCEEADTDTFLVQVMQKSTVLQVKNKHCF